MVESSGAGSCRCACQEDLQDQPSSCCSPHVFTSILLGILSCVLMTGGVFLAFHKWDLMWLMVSGVGVVLIFIGTILHCCHNIAERRMRRALNVGAKSCCARPLPTEHPGHIMVNNGSLTEQLLPLSNARSVSQLSLNMLPGYFPPVMAAYGIEQHSAVVQNINRLVQQQQQQQPSQNNGSCSPGVVSNAGKSFIVLSLPGDATTANIQNLVATVYQLDGSATESNAESSPNVPNPVSIIRPNTVPSVLKNVEVQTCNIWPTSTATTTTAVPSVATNSAENSAIDNCSTVGSIDQTNTTVTNTSGAAQANIIAQISNVNLMDCSSDTASFCDTTIPTNICDTSSPDCDLDNNALVNIPSSSSDILNELSSNVPTTSTTTDSTSILIDIPENPPSTTPSNSVLIDVIVGASNDRESLLNVSVNASDIEPNCNHEDHQIQIPLLEELVNTAIQQVDTVSLNINNDPIPNAATFLESPPDSSNLLTNTSDLLSGSNSNLSIAESEDIDDGELMARSSPPPSYDDVTLEGEAVGAFGLAYGTI